MATALISPSEEQQSNNLDEYSDESDAESEKVTKAKKSKKTGNDKWSGSLICIDTSLSRLSSVSTLSSFLVCGGPATLHKCHPALQSLTLWQ